MNGKMSGQKQITNDPQVLEYEAMRRREDVLHACRRAVECMEGFAAQARREYESASQLEAERIMDLPSKILRTNAWGAAITSTELDDTSWMIAAYMQALGRLDSENRDAADQT